MLRRVTNVEIERLDSLGPFKQTHESFHQLESAHDVHEIVEVGATADARLWWVGDGFVWAPIEASEAQVLDATRRGLPSEDEYRQRLAKMVRRVASIRQETHRSWFRRRAGVRIGLAGERQASVHRILRSDPELSWDLLAGVAAAGQPYDGSSKRVVDVDEGQIWLAKGAVWLMDPTVARGGLTHDRRAVEAAADPPSGDWDTIAECGVCIGEAITVTTFHLLDARINSNHGEFYIALPEPGSETPVPVAESAGRYFWFADEALYWTNELLSADDVALIVRDRARRQDAKLDRLRKMRAADDAPSSPRRQAIPAEVRASVWNRDGGSCVECGESTDLQFDHVIPVAKGGGNSPENIQLLCGTCNRRKSDSII